MPLLLRGSLLLIYLDIIPDTFQCEVFCVLVKEQLSIHYVQPCLSSPIYNKLAFDEDNRGDHQMNRGRRPDHTSMTLHEHQKAAFGETCWRTDCCQLPCPMQFNYMPTSAFEKYITRYNKIRKATESGEILSLLATRPTEFTYWKYVGGLRLYVILSPPRENLLSIW